MIYGRQDNLYNSSLSWKFHPDRTVYGYLKFRKYDHLDHRDYRSKIWYAGPSISGSVQVCFKYLPRFRPSNPKFKLWRLTTRASLMPAPSFLVHIILTMAWTCPERATSVLISWYLEQSRIFCDLVALKNCCSSL